MLKFLPSVKSQYFLLFGQSNLHKRSNVLFSDFGDLTWGPDWIILTDVRLWVVSDGYNSGLSCPECTKYVDMFDILSE